MKLLISLLIEVGLLIYLVRIQQKINQFTRPDEVPFLATFIKKRESKRDLKKVRKSILHPYVQSSFKVKITYWIEKILGTIGFLGGLLWFCIVIIFNLNTRLLWPTFAGFAISIIIIFLLQNQLYEFWKKQPIWKEKPIEEQPFLLPNETDNKTLNKYRLQSYSTLLLILTLVTYVSIM